MIKKEDWEAARKQFDNLQVNSIINSEIYDAALELLDKRIAEFPKEEEKDPMPEEVKEVVAEANGKD